MSSPKDLELSSLRSVAQLRRLAVLHKGNADLKASLDKVLGSRSIKKLHEMLKTVNGENISIEVEGSPCKLDNFGVQPVAKHRLNEGE